MRAATHDISVPLYEEFCTKLSSALGKPVGTGEFGADMKVELLNDGPVTICMDTKNKERIKAKRLAPLKGKSKERRVKNPIALF